MPSLTPVFLLRNFTDLFTPPPMTLTVQRMSKHVIGGPKQATIQAAGSESTLWDTVDWLRRPVTIFDETGDPVWWGMVSEVALTVGPIQVGVTLKDMANRVAIAYSRQVAGVATQTRTTTVFADDLDSQAEYGIIEAMLSMNNLDDTAAVRVRDSALAVGRLPLPTISVAGSSSLGATITCTGWWDTLGWRHYSNTNTAMVATTSQLATVIAAGAPFITGTDVISVPNPISTNPYRDGDNTTLKVVTGLLGMGSYDAIRLLATVMPDRRLQIFEEPAQPAVTAVAPTLDKQAILRDANNLLIARHTCPSGFWYRLKDVIPATINTSRLADPSTQFLEESEYTVNNDMLIPHARARATVWQITQVSNRL